jgi:hypothetical protein
MNSTGRKQIIYLFSVNREIISRSKKKAPAPGFEPGNPEGNKISSLAQYQIVPRWLLYV